MSADFDVVGDANDVTPSDEKEKLRKKMLSMLRVYPIISPTMMQIMVGTMVPPKVWRPVLDELVQEGVIIREELMVESHLGQTRMHVRLRLHDTPALWDNAA